MSNDIGATFKVYKPPQKMWDNWLWWQREIEIERSDQPFISIDDVVYGLPVAADKLNLNFACQEVADAL